MSFSAPPDDKSSFPHFVIASCRQKKIHPCPGLRPCGSARDLVVNVNNASYVVLELSDGAREVGFMSFLLVCTFNTDADHCPPCWGGAVALTKSLSFN